MKKLIEVTTVAEWEALAVEVTDVRGYACRQCRSFYGNGPQAPELARFCCTQRHRCQECGELTGFHAIHCDACWRKQEAQREAERMAKAERIPLADYDGPVFVDGLGREFFEDIGALRDHLDDEHAEDWRAHWPKAVWACTEQRIVQGILDAALRNLSDAAYEDWDADRLQGVEALGAACAAFEELNKEQVSWAPDFKRLVVGVPEE